MAPIDVVEVVGVTAIEFSVAVVTTVKVAEPDLVPNVAVMIALPADKALATPLGKIDATAIESELHVTVLLISRLLPSEKTPRAIKACVLPMATEAETGVTAIELKVTVPARTVKDVDPVLVPDVALINVVPTVMPVAIPGETTVAIVVLFELQVTVSLISRLVPSEKAPMATKACVKPVGTEGVKGVTEIESSVAEPTVKVAVPDLSPDVAVIIAFPAETLVTKPVESTVAMEVLLDVQVTVLLMSRLVPLE